MGDRVMFVTAHLQNQIRALLVGLDQRRRWLENLPEGLDEEKGVSFTTQLATERALFTAVEYMTDIASELIDALVMREAGGYLDLLKVLAEESVVTDEWLSRVEPLVEFRSKLLRLHTTITAAECLQMTQVANQVIRPFIRAIANYVNLPDPFIDAKITL